MVKMNDRVDKRGSGIVEVEKEFGRIARKDSVVSVRAVKREKIPFCVDMRIYKFSPSGEMFSTTRGFTLFVEHIPELIESLKQVYEYSLKEGVEVKE